jgi:hypothetical protein
MPTVNLVNDFGAVGDAQGVENISATITSGTKNLEVGTAIFASGDVGKAISLWASPFGASNFQSTIATFTDSTHVVLADNCTQTLTATSTDIVWGTDNTDAFTGATNSWRAFAQAETDPLDPPILEVPDGFYAWKGRQGSGQTVHYLCGNNPTITGISGNAAACGLYQLNSGEFRFGTDPAIVANAGLERAGGNSVRLQTAFAGASSVFLSNPSGTDSGGSTFGSRVVVGRACLIVCYDMQGQYNSFQGYPPNNQFYEWRTITAYNSGTGEVTLEAPLTQSYYSTYPEFGLRDTQFGSDQGGPATMWIAPDGFDTTVTLENMTLYCPNNQMGASIRHVVLNNITCVGPGLYPSTNDTFTATSCTYPQLLEVDKNVGTVTWTDCTLKGFIQQSVSPRYTYINGGTIEQARGGRYFEMNNVAFTGDAILQLGVSAYGRQDRAVINNCTGIATFGSAGAQTDDLDGQSTATAASSFFTFVGGVIRCLKSENTSSGNPGQANIMRCLAPGTWVTFDDKFIDQIADVYEDGTYFYVQFRTITDWPFTPVSRIKVHPCPDFTMTNCTGTAAQLEDWNAAPARIPLWSYSKRTYVAGASATTPASAHPFLIGRLSVAKFTPTSLYTGASLTYKQSQFDNWPLAKESDYTNTNIGVTVNMKIAGERNLVNASSATGAQSGDTLTDLTSTGSVWFYRVSNSFPVFSANVTNGDTPTIVVEFQTDQGIPSPVQTAVMPLRFRLRG